MKIVRTVALATITATLASGCARPAKEHPAGSAPSTARPPATTALGQTPTEPARSEGIAGAPVEAAAASTGGSAGSASGSAPPPAPGTSAYVGCGLPIPTARLWDETTESEVLDAISAAKLCAAQHGRRLLLEFVAPWCADCKEMAKLDEAPVVAATLEQRFERVRINIGKWDRHEALRESFGVHALATYIVIDPKTSRLVAKTTLEPITKKGHKLTAEQWASWLKAH